MPCDLALLSTLIGSNCPCLELILMVPKVLEPLKFDCILSAEGKNLRDVLFVYMDSKALPKIRSSLKERLFTLRRKGFFQVLMAH